MTLRLCAASVVLLSAMAFQSAPAHAEDDARAWFQRGVTALRNEQPERAVEAFRRSQDIRPAAATLCNLGLAYDNWGGHEPMAAEAYEACAEMDTTDRFREHAVTRAGILRARIQEQQQEPTPTPIAPPPPRDPFTMQPSSVPLPMVVTPQPAPTNSPPWTTTTDEEPSHSMLWLGLGMGAASAGAIVTGALFMLEAQADQEQLDRQLRGGTEIVEGSAAHDLVVSVEDTRRVGWIFYGVGGALLAFGTAFVVIDLSFPEQPERPVHLSVAPAPGGGMVSARLEL